MARQMIERDPRLCLLLSVSSHSLTTPTFGSGVVTCIRRGIETRSLLHLASALHLDSGLIFLVAVGSPVVHQARPPAGASSRCSSFAGRLHWPSEAQSRKAALEPLVLCNTQLRAVSPPECSVLWLSFSGCAIAVTLLHHPLSLILRIASPAQHHFRKRNVRALLGRELELRPSRAKHMQCVQRVQRARPKLEQQKTRPARESTLAHPHASILWRTHQPFSLSASVLPPCAVS